MYTQCTECKQQHVLTIKELRSSQGMLRCHGCSSIFNALEHLTEKPLKIKPLEDDILAPLDLATKKTVNWNLAISLCFMLFVFQIYYFEGYRLTQNTTLRPWLTKACLAFDCKLPAYKNLSEVTVLHASFQAITQQHSIFRTAFTNQSDFEQSYPSIKLTLQNFTGDDFAERIFLPQDYISNKSIFMKPDMSTEIVLDIATPPSKMGGYRFELI